MLESARDGNYPWGYTADIRTPQLGLILTQAFAQNNVNTYAGLVEQSVTEIIKRLSVFAYKNLYKESGMTPEDTVSSGDTSLSDDGDASSSYFGSISSKDEIPPLRELVGTGESVRSVTLTDLFAQGRV